MNQHTYQVEVKLTIELIKRMLPLVDATTCLVLVGDLSQFRALGMEGVTREEIAVENAIFRASYGRLSIPLSGGNKYLLKKNVLALVGLRTLIREVSLERYGRLLFHAPDYFRCDAELSDWFQPEFVEALAQQGVICIRHAVWPAWTTV